MSDAAPTHAEIVDLCNRYMSGEITAEEYFAAVDRRAEAVVEAEMRRLR